jgi:hypothetical protein
VATAQPVTVIRARSMGTPSSGNKVSAYEHTRTHQPTGILRTYAGEGPGLTGSIHAVRRSR